MIGDLHAAHHVGIDETADDKRHEGRQGDAGSKTEDGMKAFLVFPIRGSGNGIGNAGHHHKGEVGEESRPYQNARTAIAPYLAHHVIDDIGNGKH